MAIQIVFDGPTAAAKALGAISDGLQRGIVVKRIGRRLEREALRSLEALTPASHSTRDPEFRRGHAPLKGGWESTVINELARTRYEAIIANQAGETLGGRAVLRSLESGARKHLIFSKDGKLLTWRAEESPTRFQGRGLDARGRTVDVRDRHTGTGLVRTRYVEHPGIRHPFHMVKRTVDHLEDIMGPIVEDIAERLALVWSGRSITLGAENF